MRTLCALSFSLVLLSGCNSSSPSVPDGGLPWTTLAAATVPGSAGPPIQTAVRDLAAWRQLWSELWLGRPPILPTVDFSQDMVVLVTASTICFGGVEIEEISHTGTDLVVRYADAAPSLCLCVQAELNFHAVRLPRVLGGVQFEARETPPLCPA